MQIIHCIVIIILFLFLMFLMGVIDYKISHYTPRKTSCSACKHCIGVYENGIHIDCACEEMIDTVWTFGQPNYCKNFNNKKH